MILSLEYSEHTRQMLLTTTAAPNAHNNFTAVDEPKSKCLRYYEQFSLCKRNYMVRCCIFWYVDMDGYSCWMAYICQCETLCSEHNNLLSNEQWACIQCELCVATLPWKLSQSFYHRSVAVALPQQKVWFACARNSTVSEQTAAETATTTEHIENTHGDEKKKTIHEMEQTWLLVCASIWVRARASFLCIWLLRLLLTGF